MLYIYSMWILLLHFSHGNNMKYTNLQLRKFKLRIHFFSTNICFIYSPSCLLPHLGFCEVYMLCLYKKSSYSFGSLEISETTVQVPLNNLPSWLLDSRLYNHTGCWIKSSNNVTLQSKENNVVLVKNKKGSLGVKGRFWKMIK